MSFIKWLSDKVNPPKAKLCLRLQKIEYFLGDQLKGEVSISSDEEFDVNGALVQVSCNESLKKTRTTTTQYGTQTHEYWDNAQLYNTNTKIFGVSRIPMGFNCKYPFSINIPLSSRETYYSVDHSLKWFINASLEVIGRPSIKTETYEFSVVHQPLNQTQQVTVQKEVIKEIVLIPCSYCSSLMPQTALYCPNCGATRKK
jgi:hypothetical protein